MPAFTIGIFDISKDADRLTFRCTWSVIGRNSLILALGVSLFGFPELAVLWNGEIDPQYLSGYLSLALLPLFLLGVLLSILFRWRVPQVLDRETSTFSRGRRFVCLLNQITRVIITERVPEGGATYQLYFVLPDDRRIRLNPLLQPFTSRDEAEQFGQELAEFLGVEVWGSYEQQEVKSE